MNNSLKTFLQYRYILLCFLIVTLVILTALIGSNSSHEEVFESLSKNETVEPVSYYDYIDETENQPFVNLVEGYAIYINGKLEAANSDYNVLKNAYDKAIEDYIFKIYDNVYSYDIIDNIYITQGLFKPKNFKTSKEVYQIVSEINFNINIVISVIEEEVIPFEIIYYDNTVLVSGNDYIQIQGVDGLSLNTYLNTYNNGVLINKHLIDKNIITQAISEVVVRGIKNTDKTLLSVPMFIIPYEGKISSVYGSRILLGKNFHGGLDLTGNGKSCNGDPVKAAGDGVIVFAGYQGEFGNLIVIKHNNGVKTYYAHLSKISVAEGATVEQGQIIGNIGATGLVTGPHLHFEIRMPDESGNYERVDPKYYLINYDKYK